MKRMSLVITLGLMLTIGVTSISAQSGGGYDLTWSSIDGGSGTSNGGVYTLNGTIGQADAGNLLGGGYALSGGFWITTLTEERDSFLYLPLIRR